MTPDPAKSGLNWKLLTKKRPSSTRGIPPGKEQLAWVTNTVTLIHGKRDAVLVDTFLAERHSQELVEWVAESNKNLTTIYVTHGHGDHFFGVQQLFDRFPGARAVATKPVVAAIRREQISPEFIRTFREPRFPAQLPARLIAPDALDAGALMLEGEELRALHPDSSPRHIDETRRYLLDFIAARANASTAKELYESMLARYPNRVNPGSLWAAANAAKPS